MTSTHDKQKKKLCYTIITTEVLIKSFHLSRMYFSGNSKIRSERFENFQTSRMASKCKAHSFHIGPSSLQMKWNRDTKPALTVPSGSEISFDLLDGGNNQITANSTLADISRFRADLADPIFGPVYVSDAEPGDVLKVEFLDLQPADYAWTALGFGYGVIAEDFPHPWLKIWDLGPEAMARGWTVFKPGIEIPIRPFLGVVGVAPGEEGEFSTIPPRGIGGNIDCKYITRGSTLYLPVKVEGALFSCGDGHGAQGDGEVGGCAMECPMKARVRLTVEKNMPWVQSPQYLTNPESLRQAEVLSKGEYACLGIDSDLFEASRKACREMIDWLVGTKSLNKEEACCLISVAGDLKIVEAVDMPNHAVAVSMPLSIFVGPKHQ
jgi:acetamidase/formamidase